MTLQAFFSVVVFPWVVKQTVCKGFHSSFLLPLSLAVKCEWTGGLNELLLCNKTSGKQTVREREETTWAIILHLMELRSVQKSSWSLIWHCSEAEWLSSVQSTTCACVYNCLLTQLWFIIADCHLILCRLLNHPTSLNIWVYLELDIYYFILSSSVNVREKHNLVLILWGVCKRLRLEKLIFHFGCEVCGLFWLMVGKGLLLPYSFFQGSYVFACIYWIFMIPELWVKPSSKSSSSDIR